MKPQGRKPKRHNYPDCHCRRDGRRVKSWWEEETETQNKARDRREARKEIEQAQEEVDE